MDIQYKIVCRPQPAEHCVTLLLNGKIDEAAIPELEESIREASSARQRVFLDLSEVTLVDRKAVQFFSDHALQGVKLLNCPMYLKRWIARQSDLHSPARQSDLHSPARQSDLHSPARQSDLHSPARQSDMHLPAEEK